MLDTRRPPDRGNAPGMERFRAVVVDSARVGKWHVAASCVPQFGDMLTLSPLASERDASASDEDSLTFIRLVADV